MAIKAKRTPQQDPYLGKVIAGRYRIEARLGEGGMGIVYRARHVLIDRVVALKIIRPDLRSETHLRQWMLREARAANRVDHAHIVQIHDIGETDTNELYLVMEYLVGISLASVCAKGPLPVTRAVDILEQMCAALTRAHDLGVVHRDLKSDNIMLTVQGGRKDFVKILDFGLAALARDTRLAPKGAVFGTPEYMAPEQARGEDASALCDLYALGILFFEMLTGELPFRSNNRETLLEMQRTAPAPHPSAIRPEIGPQVERIILKLLEKDPEKRFRDGHHLQEELRAFQRSLPTHQWEKLEQSEQPAPPPLPPPAPTPGVQEWGTRAANFARMLARGYPNGKAPEDIQEAVDTLWDLASRASRLEGELASHQRRLESIGRRGRALRAEIGRKVESQAADESRALREASTARTKAAQFRGKIDEASAELKRSLQEAEEAIKNQTELARICKVFEAVGHARATVAAHEGQYKAYKENATRVEAHASKLRKQIDELRGELQHYSDALENDLSVGRELIAKRVESALNYEKSFSEASIKLINHFKDRPECRDILKELTESDWSSHHLNRVDNNNDRSLSNGS